jgi:hypothetical protein
LASVFVTELSVAGPLASCEEGDDLASAATQLSNPATQKANVFLMIFIRFQFDVYYDRQDFP